MPEALFPLAYFAPISYYVALVNYKSVLIEASENYQKQTYRNRQYIYGANGKLMLNIPVKHSQSGKRLTYKNSQIENEFSWQDLHFKSLEAAYRTSPYFEFYEADIEPLYKTEYSSLFDFNMACFKTTIELLGLELQFNLTQNYTRDYQDLADHRGLIIAKGQMLNTYKNYYQVFDEKYGFIPNLSILDLLFNLGPESISYLKSINQIQP